MKNHKTQLLLIIAVVSGYGLIYKSEKIQLLDTQIQKQKIIIQNQTKTIDYLTAKYIGTIEEQKLLKEANMLLKERNNAK